MSSSRWPTPDSAGWRWPTSTRSARATTEFGSATFLADLRFAADRAHELGLRFDLTLGSGWSFGGPHISNELAARQLHWERREIGPGPMEVPVVSAWPGDDLIAAYVGAGSLQEQPAAYEWLPVTDGRLMIEAGSGPRVVLLAYARLTGQNVKRAAAGAEGLVLDHYSAAATEAHLRAVGDPMLDAVPAELVGSVFCDSLEVYGADWTPRLPAEFARRRGYDVLPLLHLLTVDGPDSARLRADYHRTLAELYEENFVAVCRALGRRRGVPFRIQATGAPPATVSSYRFADLFEGEGWGWRDIPQTRWASSAAHLYGRPVVSAEAWTWVHSPSFRATPLDLKGEAHEHFLNGVNQLVGHGWPYSPADAPGLGWFFYAAGALDDRNPWWPAMPELTRYLSRLCWLLRQGEAVADVALYVPNEDLFATMGRAQAARWTPGGRPVGGSRSSIPGAIRTAGLDYDLVDDDALVGHGARTLPRRRGTGRDERPGGDRRTGSTGCGHPAARLSTTAWPMRWRRSSQTWRFRRGRRRSASFTVAAAISISTWWSTPGPTTSTFGIVARTDRASYEQWDPMTGHVLRAGATTDGIELTLQPYEAAVLVLSDGLSAERDCRRTLRELSGECSLTGRMAGGVRR